MGGLGWPPSVLLTASMFHSFQAMQSPPPHPCYYFLRSKGRGPTPRGGGGGAETATHTQTGTDLAHCISHLFKDYMVAPSTY